MTTTTMDYGDLSPPSTASWVIAGILKLVGIGFLRMLMGTIETFFLQGAPDEKDMAAVPNIPRTINVSDMDDADYLHVVKFIEFFRLKNSEHQGNSSITQRVHQILKICKETSPLKARLFA